jgi:hypothetical protein
MWLTAKMINRADILDGGRMEGSWYLNLYNIRGGAFDTIHAIIGKFRGSIDALMYKCGSDVVE